MKKILSEKLNEVEKKLEIIIDACEDKQGFDIKAINIGKNSSIADYFLIVSGNSSTQVQSIADGVDEKMSKAGYEDIGKEGYRSGRWILLDFSDIIVHVFHKEERDYYNLERLWNEEQDQDKE